jgi:hypothetical protein
MRQVANPIYGANRFKLGLFNANCDGGFAVSTAPERWAADWDEIVAASKLADEAGLDFILPVAKWRGLGGDADNLGRSYETLTHSAAIGAITKRIALFATVHVSVVTPAFCREGDCDDRSCHAWPRRAQHRLRLEPGRVRRPRCHHRCRASLRPGSRMVQDLCEAAGGRCALRLGRHLL